MGRKAVTLTEGLRTGLVAGRALTAGAADLFTLIVLADLALGLSTTFRVTVLPLLLGVRRLRALVLDVRRPEAEARFFDEGRRFFDDAWREDLPVERLFFTAMPDPPGSQETRDYTYVARLGKAGANEAKPGGRSAAANQPAPGRSGTGRHDSEGRQLSSRCSAMTVV